MMFKKFLASKFFNLLTIVSVIIFCIFTSLKPGLSQQVDFRISNLENDIRRVDLRLQQIELMLNKNNQLPSLNSPLARPNSPDNTKGSLSNYQRDKMLNRLATLVVEIKQEVNQLKLQVSKLQSKKS